MDLAAVGRGSPQLDLYFLEGRKEGGRPLGTRPASSPASGTSPGHVMPFRSATPAIQRKGPEAQRWRSSRWRGARPALPGQAACALGSPCRAAPWVGTGCAAILPSHAVGAVLSPAPVPAGPGLRLPSKGTPHRPQVWPEERTRGVAMETVIHPPITKGFLVFSSGGKPASALPSPGPQGWGGQLWRGPWGPSGQARELHAAREGGPSPPVREYEQHLARSVVIILSLL